MVFEEAAGTLVGLQETVVLESTGLTVTVTSAEATDADALSLTRSSKLQIPDVARSPVESDGFEKGVQPVEKNCRGR